MGGKTLNSFAIGSRVPQGSILGPTLFCLYINDAEDNLSHNVHLAVYSDDTILKAKLIGRQNVAYFSRQLMRCVLTILSITFDITERRETGR